MTETFTTSGWTAVTNMRVEPRGGLDDFPTPPWATRALLEKIVIEGQSVWEPAAGRGIMAATLAERASVVIASDVAEYGNPEVHRIDFLKPACAPQTDWIITNPPFNLAVPFVLKALPLARQGVAMLVRSNWVESAGRYNKLFKDHPPSFIMPFCERVPMIRGRYDPGASSATSYSWFVWDLPLDPSSIPRVRWIKPGRKAALFRESDLRFAPPKAEWPSELKKRTAMEKRNASHPNPRRDVRVDSSGPIASINPFDPRR